MNCPYMAGHTGYFLTTTAKVREDIAWKSFLGLPCWPPPYFGDMPWKTKSNKNSYPHWKSFCNGFCQSQSSEDQWNMKPKEPCIDRPNRKTHGNTKPWKDEIRRPRKRPIQKSHGNTKQKDPWKHQARRPMETPCHGKMKWEGSWKDQVRGAIESGSCSLWWQYDLVG